MNIFCLIDEGLSRSRTYGSKPFFAEEKRIIIVEIRKFWMKRKHKCIQTDARISVGFGKLEGYFLRPYKVPRTISGTSFPGDLRMCKQSEINLIWMGFD